MPIIRHWSRPEVSVDGSYNADTDHMLAVRVLVHIEILKVQVLLLQQIKQILQKLSGIPRLQRVMKHPPPP